jgi:hypothetical protein
MILFSFGDKENPGGQHLGVGISRENVDRLLTGKPIRISLLNAGLNVDRTIMIYFGETEQALSQAVAEFIGPETKVNIDPRLKSKMT